MKAGTKALHLNWCEITIVREGSGKQLYHNAWITSQKLTAKTVPDLSAAGQDWLKAHPRDMAASTAPLPRDAAIAAAPQPGPRTEDFGDYDRALFERLRAWRLEKAKEMGKPPFVVLHDKVLKRIASSCPATEQDLARVKGIGPRKLEQYASAVLDIVASHKKNPPQEET